MVVLNAELKSIVTIHVLIVQMEFSGDGIISGVVWTLCELQWVQRRGQQGLDMHFMTTVVSATGQQSLR